MLENDDDNTTFPMTDADEHGDIHTRTLALLRRILVGNGYRFEQIDLIEEEKKDILIHGRFDLNLTTNIRTHNAPGLSTGNENQLFHVRDQYMQYRSNLENSMEAEGDWVEEIRGMTAARPEATWGLKSASWPLNTLDQIIALVEPCEQCHGEKFETCQTCNGQREEICQHCYEKGQITCQHCRGTGSDPQSDSGNPCPQCRGMRHITCPRCQGKGRINCEKCRGEGRMMCKKCQGHGFFTETSQISVSVTGSFKASAPSPKPPDAVLNLFERIGIAELGQGHAIITADPERKNSPEPAIFSVASLPYARFTLKLDEKQTEVQAVGMQPMLAQLPKILDPKIAPIIPRLTLDNLPNYCQQYRLVRELTEALASGVKPRTFFINRYPYGLSPKVGMELADRIQNLFSGATSRPRLIAAAAATTASAAVLYYWLANPRPQFIPPSLPVSVADTAAISIMAFLALAAVEITGRQSLKGVLDSDQKVASTGGKIAMGTFAAVVAIGLFLLWLPDIRPEWVSVLIQHLTG